MTLLFFGPADNIVFRVAAQWLLQVSAGLLTVTMFFLIYWILPNRRLPWRAVLPSALVTRLGCELARLLSMAVLPWLDFKAVYGPIATSVGLMLWAFLTGLLLHAGPHSSATSYTLRLARQADIEANARP